MTNNEELQCPMASGKWPMKMWEWVRLKLVGVYLLPITIVDARSRGSDSDFHPNIQTSPIVNPPRYLCFMKTDDTTEADIELIVSRTLAWVNQFVVGLKLCPFAPPVVDGNRLRIVISEARAPDALYEDYVRELEFLLKANLDELETTLIVHPYVLDHFLEYNDFLRILEVAMEEADLESLVQVASFHPDYQFEGEEYDDPSNYTNRSPYPMLHLLREDSLDKALKFYPDPEYIPLRNIATMRSLGIEKIKAMLDAL